MANPIMAFFLLVGLCSLISGIYLPRLSVGSRGRNFGHGLIFLSTGFAVWAWATQATTIESLNHLITIGLGLILVGMLFFLRSATQHLSKGSRRFVLILTALYMITLILVRHYLPSNPNFIGSGLFLFNPHPLVKFMQIILFSVILSANSLTMFYDMRPIDRISANTFFVALLIIQIGLVLLLGTAEDILIMLTGASMVLAFVLLLLTSLGFFRQRQVRRYILFIRQMFHRSVAPRLAGLSK